MFCYDQISKLETHRELIRTKTTELDVFMKQRMDINKLTIDASGVSIPIIRRLLSSQEAMDKIGVTKEKVCEALSETLKMQRCVVAHQVNYNQLVNEIIDQSKDIDRVAASIADKFGEDDDMDDELNDSRISKME